MKKFSDWKIKTKIFFSVGITVIALVAALLGYNIYHLVTEGEKEIRRYESEEIAKINENLKDFVYIAYETLKSHHMHSQDKKYLESKYGYRSKNIIDQAESVINIKIEKVRRGNLSLAAAQRQVREEIKRMRYDGGTGYIWINDTGKPFPRMIMHPTIPSLDGQVLDDPKYNNAFGTDKNLFQAFVEVGEKDGEGFVDYLWPKPTAEGLTEEMPKLSYVKLIKPWNWIIGTGIYIDEAILDAKKMSVKIIKQTRYAGGAGYFWINDTGKPFPRMIMHPLIPSLDGQVLDDPKYNSAYGTDKNLFQAFVEVGEEKGEGFVDYLWPKPTEDGLTEEDQPKSSFVRLFEPWGWIIGTGVYLDDIERAVVVKRESLQGDIFRSSAISVGIALLLLIGATVVLNVLLNAVTGPIFKIVDWSKYLAEGDLVRQIEYRNGDEIGTLSSNLNKAVGSLRTLTANIKVSSDRNIEVKEELASGTEETLSSLTEIAANADSIMNQIANLDNNIATSSSAVEEITANIESLNSQIEDQSSAVTESTASVEEMLASLGNVAMITRAKKESTDRLVETAKKGGGKLSSTISIIEEIAGSVDSILEMISIINSVASKTSLLSMNAAIEAAHAGEYGKGFAVVADEIRKLAESSSENSKNISKVLKDVVDKIKQASEVSGETSSAFEEIDSEIGEVASALAEIASTTDEMLTGSDQILKAMTSLNDISVRVKEGSGEMKSGARNAAESQENVKRISTEVLNGMNEIVEGTKHITEAMNNLSDVSTALSRSEDELNAEVNKFKTS